MKIKILILIAFILLPLSVFANGGSPMLFFALFHLLILNAVIGIIESKIISKFKIQNRCWLIIIANYVSMYVGILVLSQYSSGFIEKDSSIFDMTGAFSLAGFWFAMFIAYIATLIIEFPFAYFAVKEKIMRKKVFIPFFVANTITNICMTLLYFLQS